jgi:hypothetical protein
MTLAPDMQILIRCFNLGEHDLKFFEQGENSVHSDHSGSENVIFWIVFEVEEALTTVLSLKYDLITCEEKLIILQLKQFSKFMTRFKIEFVKIHNDTKYIFMSHCKAKGE